MVQWHNGTEIVLPMHLLPGQFCFQWLIQRAPLSLQYFNGPIYEHDLDCVLTRYQVVNSLNNRPPFQLVANPTDIVNYYDDGFLQEK